MASDLDRMRADMERLSGKRAKKKHAQTADTSLKRVLKKQDRSRAARRSKAKGSGYERKTAKKLKPWVGDSLHRTPGSGGWKGSAEFGAAGDLMSKRKKFPLHIECKKREGWTLEDLIIGVRSNKTDSRSVLGWWAQTLRTCPPGKIPFLIFARNRVPDFVMLHSTDYYKMVNGDFTVDFLPHFRFALDTGEVVIFALDDFMVKVRPPRGCKGYKRWKPPTTKRMVKASRINDN